MAIPQWLTTFIIELERRCTERDFENLKLQSRSFGFYPGELERIGRVTKLLESMHQRALLGPDNFGPLKAMFRGCGDDMNEVLAYIEEVEAQHSHPPGCAPGSDNDQEMDFKILIHQQIMESLTQSQYNLLKKMYTGPSQIPAGVAENLKKIDFPDKLKGLGLLSETNLGGFKRDLKTIQASDLLGLIDEYERKYELQ